MQVCYACQQGKHLPKRIFADQIISCRMGAKWTWMRLPLIASVAP